MQLRQSRTPLQETDSDTAIVFPVSCQCQERKSVPDWRGADFHTPGGWTVQSQGEMDISTRPATDSDTDFARRAHHQGYHDVVVRQFGAWDESVQDRMLNGDWTNADYQILVCDGVPCGYVSVEQRADYVHVREFVVLTEFQGKGIGTAFLRAVMRQARERRVPVRLGVLKENLAVVLYERLGFREYDRSDTHLMMVWDDRE